MGAFLRAISTYLFSANDELASIQGLCKFALSSRCWLRSLRLDWVYCLRIIHKLSALSLEVVIMETQDQAADNLVQFRLLYTYLVTCGQEQKVQ